MKPTSLRLRGALLCLGLLAAVAAQAEGETPVTSAPDDGSEPVVEQPVPSTAQTDGGTIDGIYSCEADVAGSKQQTFLTINGKKDGKSIYLIAAATPTANSIAGFGMGLVSGKTFTGATSDGKKFSFQLGFASSDGDAAYETITLTGKAGVKTRAGQLANAELSCKSLW